MAYGELKVDSITFTDGGSDKTVSVSGLVKNPTFSGDIIVNGNISGITITGDYAGFGSVTGVTVTGTTANFVSGVFTSQISGTAITGNTAGFTTVTGTTITGTTANFVTVSGTTVTGDAAQFTSITGGTAGFTTVTGTTVTGTTVNFVTVSGTAITGDTAGFTTVTGTTVTGTTANFVTVSGTTVTGDTGNFTSISATTTTITSGVFASGTEAAPSVSVGTTDNGLYSPGTDQVAISTNGTERVEFGTSEVVFNDGGANYDFRIEGDTEANLFFVDASTNRVGLGTSSPSLIFNAVGSSNQAAQIVAGFGGTSGTTGQGAAIGFSAEGVANRYKTGIGNIRTGGFDVSALCFYANNTASGGDFTSSDERMRITSDGKVGIGTTNPGTQLEIAGSASTLLRLDSSNGNGGVIRIRNSGVDTHYFGSSADFLTGGAAGETGIRSNSAILFGISSNEKARIDSSGRLLVGTSTASTGTLAQYSKLQILGNTSSSTSGAQLNLGRNETSTSVGNGELLGRIHFTDNQAGEYAAIEAEADGTPGVGDYPGRLVFSTTAAGDPSPTERVSINSDKSIKVNGIYHLVESRSYTASTSPTDVFVLTTTGTHGAATFKWTFVDTSFEEGARVGTIDLAWQRLALTAGTTGINSTANASATRGTFTGISWSVGSTGSNSITLAVTGTTTSGAGTLYIWCESPYITKIVDA